MGHIRYLCVPFSYIYQRRTALGCAMPHIVLRPQAQRPLQCRVVLGFIAMCAARCFPHNICFHSIAIRAECRLQHKMRSVFICTLAQDFSCTASTASDKQASLPAVAYNDTRGSYLNWVPTSAANLYSGTTAVL